MVKGVLCRSILYPKCVRAGVFDDLALVQLFDVNGDKSVYALSLASRYLLKNDIGAHGYGCRTAQRMNDAYQAREGVPAPPEKRTHYLGFYDITGRDVTSLPSEHYAITVRHLTEHGERAHFQLEFQDVSALGASKSADKTRRNDRNLSLQAMVDRMLGPKRHICDQDQLDGGIKDFVLPDLPRSASPSHGVGI